ncbi:MAG: hypothetical protein JXX29_21375 [Deltaproteobacteria bacterium]|nr:hypothetical protein [Deltaproteobacteria bacterium]MBN2674248.1 hypothetical protein [Deltaproteobacteria bacterium]
MRFFFLIVTIAALLCATDAQSRTGTPKRILLLDTTPCCTEQHWAAGTDEFIKEIASVGAQVIIAEDTHTELIDHRDRLLDAYSQLTTDVDVVVRLVKNGTEGTAYILLWNRKEQPVLRSLRFDNIDRPEQLSVSILQVVEVVVAALTDIPKPPPQPTEQTKPSPQSIESKTTTPIAAANNQPKWSIDISLNGLWSPGGVGPQLGSSIGVSIIPSNQWRLTLEGLWIPVVANISENDLHASIDMAIIRGYGYAALSSRKKFQPFVGVGGGAAAAWTKQLHADTALKSRKWVTYLGVSLLMKIALHSHVSAAFGINAGILAPKFDIQFDGERVAHCGMPLLETTVRIGSEW